MGWWSKKIDTRPEIIWHVPEERDDLVPVRKTPGSLAYDLVSPSDIRIPGWKVDLGVGSALVNTLVIATIPDGYGLLFASRSGLADKGITVEAGVIDSDYRGFLKVLLFNHSAKSYQIKAGDRIAQARIVKIEDLKERISCEYPDPNETARGDGGFGSTGR